jgi:hypothetical protein
LFNLRCGFLFGSRRHQLRELSGRPVRGISGGLQLRELSGWAIPIFVQCHQLSSMPCWVVLYERRSRSDNVSSGVIEIEMFI